MTSMLPGKLGVSHHMDLYFQRRQRSTHSGFKLVRSFIRDTVPGVEYLMITSK